MKKALRRATAAALILGVCCSAAGAAQYGREIIRQENGNYVLYEPYSETNIIETPYHLYELTYIGSTDGMAGIHSTEIPYYCAKNGADYLLWTASGKSVVAESGLRAAGFISDGGYLVVQDRQSGAYGVWSVSRGQLTVPCSYQQIRLLNGPYEGAEAAPPETVAAVLQNGKTWSALRVYDGKSLVPGEFDAVSTVSGLLAVQSGGKTSYYDMRDGTAAQPEGAAHADELSAWAAEEVENAVKAELVPAEMQAQYTQPCTRQEFCKLVAAVVAKRTEMTVQQLAVCRDAAAVSFSDTEDQDILACAALGIVNGVGNGKFAPNASIKREEAAAMLYRAASVLNIGENQSHVAFADENDISDYAKAAVAAVSAMQSADGKSVMQGVGQNRFAPKAIYTREQSILTAYRLHTFL